MGDPSRVRVTGPLMPYAEGFRAQLADQGYAPFSACAQLRLAAHLSRWLALRGLSAGNLTDEVAADFIQERREAGHRRLASAKALVPLLGYLLAVDARPSPPALIPSTPTEELCERFRAYLSAERGLAARTATGYLHALRPFLIARTAPNGDLALEDLGPGEIASFVVAHCPSLPRGSAKLLAVALRSLLAFLHVEGIVGGSLASCVPTVASWRLSGLPRALAPEEVRSLLGSCEGRGGVGLRDRAVLLLLVRLGLRAGEVAGLELSDIDWRGGDLVVRGKGDRAERLPLPDEVGRAVASYLHQARPARCQSRMVFLRVKAPWRGLSGGGVTMLVAGAARRAGLGAIYAHRLRHTAACELLRAGSSLEEIGQLLRHRSALTTAIYAKVDRRALRTLARPWPEQGR